LLATLAHERIERSNTLGLHDTHGNVWEWCKDGYGTTRQFHAGDGERQVVGITNRVFRGGAFNSPAAISRSAYRYYFPPDSRVDCLGVRPARAIAP
jgi:formylglycine-generating enzyme required for sulfatase activity